MDIIRFFGTQGPHGFLSNFFPCRGLTAGGFEGEFPTVEHLFQAAKFFSTDPAWAEEIRKAPYPAMAKKLGGSRSHPMRKDWDSVKDDIMYKVVLAKFKRNPVLGEKLLATGVALLVEASPYDSYWGTGSSGMGRNQLGKTLVKVRGELKA